MNWRAIKHNKWVSRIFNVSYIIALIYCIDKGIFLWFMLISSLVVGILYWKQLYGIMRAGGDFYADWCRKTADKTVNKMNPWKDHVEELKESVSNGTDTTISDVPDSDIGHLDGSGSAKIVSKHETQEKDKKDHQD